MTAYCALITLVESLTFMNGAELIIKELHIADQDSAVREQKIFCRLLKRSSGYISLLGRCARRKSGRGNAPHLQG